MRATRIVCRCTCRFEAGFSLVEALVAAALGLVVVAAAFAVVSPAVRTAQAQPAMADMQQRARVALDAVALDLRAAGSGLVSSDAFGGALGRFFAPVLPRRLGLRQAHPFDVARDDVLTVYSVGDGLRQARLAEPLWADGRLVTSPSPGCPPVEVVCGFRPGTTLIVFDQTGRFGLFLLASVDALAGQVKPLGVSALEPYPSGSAVAEVTARTYYFDDAARQLRRYDGQVTDVPVVDDVVDVTFRLAGDAEPPIRPKPPDGTANCLYDAGGGPVGGLQVLSPLPPALVALPLSMLADGPWCGSGDYRYDADLLRVRQVRIRITLQATSDFLRARGPGYRHAGSGHDALRLLPDLSLSVAVAPRPLSGGR